jgi:hypothetical protein
MLALWLAVTLEEFPSIGDSSLSVAAHADAARAAIAKMPTIKKARHPGIGKLYLPSVASDLREFLNNTRSI